MLIIIFSYISSVLVINCTSFVLCEESCNVITATLTCCRTESHSLVWPCLKTLIFDVLYFCFKKVQYFPFYLRFLRVALLHGNKGYGYKSYSSLIINYHASKCTIPDIAAIGDNSTDGIK